MYCDTEQRITVTDSTAFPVNVAEATLVKHRHRHNLKEALQEKSKLAQHAYKEGHRVIWVEARIF
jgi:hypothetical protein